MAETTYTYSLSADFPGGKINPTKLVAAIAASAIVTALARIDGSGDVVDIVFKDALSSTGKTILDGDTTAPAGGLIASTDTSPSLSGVTPVQFADSSGNAVPTIFDGSGAPVIVPNKPTAAKENLVSPNWCDRTTWWQASVEVVDETLADSGAHMSYESDHAFWIDTKHGKIFQEDNLVSNNSNKWRSTVKVDGVTKVENSPGDTNGDYAIDYATGVVTFNAALVGTEVVTASYWYSPDTAGSSAWAVQPSAGFKYSLLRVELQFSADINIKDTAVFQAFGWVDVFAPQLMQAPYNLPSHTLIPLGDPFKYKGVMDYISESNGSYPIIKAFGGTDKGGWRAAPQDIYTLVWEYLSRTEISSAAGMKLQVSLENDIPFGGFYASATLYCTKEAV